jgi:lipoate-protein ligase A
VIETPLKDAFFNLALEQFLLEKALEGELMIALTNWLPSVSVGISQSISLDVNIKECEKRNIKIVRRFSGGRSVYLDENYIVVYVAGPRSYFPSKMEDLRKQLCELFLPVLNELGVPAKFFPPDNLVIDKPRIRMIGNSGQVVKKDVVLLQSSLRYNLTKSGIKTMLSVLKTNGFDLMNLESQIKNRLAFIREFTEVKIDYIKKKIVENAASYYGCSIIYWGDLTDYDKSIVEKFSKNLMENPIEDKPYYKSRGICYLYCGEECIVPEMKGFI